ncbi:hypothetical protein ACFW0S_01490 [Citrobacter freundii]|uniref:hypothetical protein n=1 Tax=Citrobacter freundii TaxID=546 RepID=UPI00366FBB67
MDVNVAKDIFKEKYSTAGLELVDEHADELFFKLRGSSLIKVSAEELQSYINFESVRADFQENPVECCMSSVNYREQMITPASRYLHPFLISRNGPFIFGDPNSGELYAEIGEATDDFKNFFRFREGYLEYSVERIRRRPSYEGMSLLELLYTPFTIRVYNLNASDHSQAIKKSQNIIEGCLFNLSYLKRIPLTLEEKWPRRIENQRPFQFGEREVNGVYPLPRGNLNTDILRFYQRGMGTDDPVNQFLSFYQVLEYFFVSISDEELYRRMSAIINDPAFSAKPKQLDKLIQETANHKRESDETEMLRMVLKHFIDEVELTEFIEQYEDYLGDKWFTKKRTIFGEETDIRTQQGHVISNVSKRVKMIRNTLVHSSDRYNRKDGYIPNSHSEAIVKKEVPLVKYLAEKVIIANSYS